MEEEMGEAWIGFPMAISGCGKSYPGYGLATAEITSTLRKNCWFGKKFGQDIPYCLPAVRNTFLQKEQLLPHW